MAQASYAYQADGLRNDMAWDRAEGMPLIVSGPVVVPGGIQQYVTGPGARVVEIDLLPVASTTGSVSGNGFTTTQTVYVHTDAMGSTRLVTSANGTPLVGYTYDPYGQATQTTLSAGTTSIVNPFLFQGQYVDPLSGLMYLRTRWYDPTTAQFLTKDPLLPITRSTYAYAHGDPVNGGDPNGLCAPSSPSTVLNSATITANAIDLQGLSWLSNVVSGAGGLITGLTCIALAPISVGATLGCALSGAAAGLGIDIGGGSSLASTGVGAATGVVAGLTCAILVAPTVVGEVACGFVGAGVGTLFSYLARKL